MVRDVFYVTIDCAFLVPVVVIRRWMSAGDETERESRKAVEKVNPDLVVHDKKGKPYSVRYDQVNAMLLNEFLKEHKAAPNEEA